MEAEGMMFWGDAAGCAIFGGFFGVSGLGGCCQHCQCCQAKAMQEQYASYLAMPRRTIPAGITWERLGPNRHLVTIRPKDEEVVDYNLALNGLSFDIDR